ncbi:hypothetical protein GSI_12289 [Ganoderma sinense ZZ0214-1]|uniref:BTB domain-containing protein n=1 Tax=Ganoderma sinense ZZ0214-1 TaxID=1077348 RepID=A0A2G8RYD6_9APHY|nr:hypothetical protein GSI_12289 [Ganoderma sinense ZZ0214-1]
MSADNATVRPPKRARRSPEQDNSPQHGSTSTGALLLTNHEHHPEFWFDDGNIILVTPKHMGFRIFRGLLAAQSTVFADMFASSSPSADETLDGCPVVQVADSHVDLAHLFRVLLPTSPIKWVFHLTVTKLPPLNVFTSYLQAAEPNHERVRSFDEISAVIRLAHKYHIPSIQEQALRALQAYHFTSDFDVYFGPPKNHISLHNIQHIGAVNLARLTDTPLMLPSALYGCCHIGGRLLDGWTREDGTVEHLSTDDIKRCFDAHFLLAREQAPVPSRLCAPVPLDRCTERGRCKLYVTALAGSPSLVEMVMKEDMLTDRSPLIRSLQSNSMCDGCMQVLLEWDRLERKRVWDRLPQIFGIAVDGWAKVDGKDAQS